MIGVLTAGKDVNSVNLWKFVMNAMKVISDRIVSLNFNYISIYSNNFF
jgi:hypothetical protein